MPDPLPEKEVFAAAAVLPAAERPAYLDVACAGRPGVRQNVEQWLQTHDADSFMEAGAPPICPSEIATEMAGMKPEAAGEQIGPYKLMEQIGQGGFGTVWVADQEKPVRRRVALKIVKLGMDTKEVIARFEQERQALAMMDHPHIAKVLDAGTTQWGRPYFVMELVRGIKITDYCDKANLPTAERLALFIQVCNAVQHAHQKGIIHRDLKPSNILVTLHDGVPVPKVIDFGVAKATQQQRLTDLTIYTQFQQMIGTPLYMSPEQAEMSGLDIDTRSDIYSLGVLLYELLTGRTPFDPGEMMKAGLDEIRRVIREQEPQSPSTFVSSMSAEVRTSVAQRRQADGAKLIVQIRGDLDWIVMKALEKDRIRRYETANGLALDIGRHLASEPVLARPSSRLYRFRRLVRRNKLAFTAGALVALALLLTVIVLAASRARITRERNDKDLALEQRKSALADAEEQLFSALLNSARALRFSRQPGQRLDSLDALRKAAAIRPDERLRDEAIAAMALPDVRPGPSWSNDRPEYIDGEGRLSVTWDAESIVLHSVPDGREVRRIKTGRAARDITFSRDGRFVAEQDVEWKLHIWRVNDGEPVFSDELGKCMCWSFSPDGRYLAVPQFDSIRVMDLTTGREINRCKTGATPWSLAFHPVNHQIAVGYVRSPMTSVYDTSDGALVANLPVGTMAEQVVAWHPDGIRLAVGGSDPRIQIWDVPAERKVATLAGHAQQVTVLGFHPQGSLLVSGAWDAVHRLWEPASGRQVLQFSHLISSFDFSNDGRWVGAYATDAGGGQLLEVAVCPEYRTLVSSLGPAQGEFFDGDVSPDGRLLAMGMKDGVTIWEIASGREVSFLPIRSTQSAFFQPDGRELITCGDAGLQRWPLPERTNTSQPFQPGAPQKIALPFSIPTRACRSRDGRLIAVTSEDENAAVVVDAATGAPLHTATHAHNRAGFVALSPDGKWLATAGWRSQRLRLWNVDTGKMAHEWNPGPLSIAFTPDSRELAWMRKEECGFWSVDTFQPVRRLPRAASAYVTPAVFSPDEKLVAVEVTPGVIHLTELATGRLVAKLTDPFGDRATWMSFTPDGTQIVTASQYSKVIHVWDLRLIRARLKEMKLDWQWPVFPPAK